ncbi:hypothetical protein GGH19_000029, partial [Coemansia sp. RSA 1807]
EIHATDYTVHRANKKALCGKRWRDATEIRHIPASALRCVASSAKSSRVVAFKVYELQTRRNLCLPVSDPCPKFFPAQLQSGAAHAQKEWGQQKAKVTLFWDSIHVYSAVEPWQRYRLGAWRSTRSRNLPICKR